MNKLIKHYKLWYEWQEYCIATWYYKVAVLLGIVKSYTFEEFKGRKRARALFEQRRKNDGYCGVPKEEDTGKSEKTP